MGLTLTEEKEGRGIVDEYARLHGRLAKKYGEPQEAVLRASADCQNDLRPCLKERAATLRSEWRWSSGQRVILMLVPSDDGIAAVLDYASRDAKTPDSGL